MPALHRATRLDAGDARSHRALGLALLRTNRLVEAAASFELAIVIDEEVAVAHYNLAVALDCQGLKDRAIAAYRRQPSLHPRWPTLPHQMQRIQGIVGRPGPRSSAPSSPTKPSAGA